MGTEGGQVPENQEGMPRGLRVQWGVGLAYGGIESKDCKGILLPVTLAGEDLEKLPGRKVPPTAAPVLTHL